MNERRAELIYGQVLQRMDMTRETGDEELQELIRMTLEEASEKEYLPLNEKIELSRELFHAFRKLDILQELLEDPKITEIMVNGTDHIFYEKGGRLFRSERKFMSEERLVDVIQQIVGEANRYVTDMLHRLETMMLMGIDLPLAAVQRQIASALDIIIHLGRLRDKSRKVLQITEIEKYESGKIHTRTLYEFREEGMEHGKIKGRLMKVAELSNQEKLMAAGYKEA